MTSTCNNRDQLSAEGSNDYKVWKEETLANQTGQIEAVQTTGLWQQFNEVQMVKRERDENHFMVEVAPGCRLAENKVIGHQIGRLGHPSDPRPHVLQISQVWDILFCYGFPYIFTE